MKINHKTIILFCLILHQDLKNIFAQSQIMAEIGNQTWTNVNLSVERFRNGEIVKKSNNKEDWLKAGYK